MSTHHHLTRSAAARQNALHIHSILLTLRRPATPEELASQCQSLFDATASLVLRLCSIPNSPICVTAEGFVTVSEAAAAMGGFDVKTNIRKRKGEQVNVAAVSVAKRKRKRKRKLCLPIETTAGEAVARLMSLPNASCRDSIEVLSHLFIFLCQIHN